jgi:hypothetical protein
MSSGPERALAIKGRGGAIPILKICRGVNVLAGSCSSCDSRTLHCRYRRNQDPRLAQCVDHAGSDDDTLCIAQAALVVALIMKGMSVLVALRNPSTAASSRHDPSWSGPDLHNRRAS